MRYVGKLAFIALLLACSESDTPTGPEQVAAQQNEPPAVQASAPTKPPPLLRVVTVNKNASPQLTHYFAAANCPEGTVVIGGGVRFRNIDGTSGFNYVNIAAFGPSDNNGYFFWYRVTQALPYQVQVTALCLRL